MITPRYIIASAGIILAILGVVFGSFLPLRKSELYINALQNLSNVKSVDDFKSDFDPALNFPSPIGDEELTKYLANDIVGVVQNNQTEDASRALLQYIEPRIYQNNVRHLITMGQGYSYLWLHFKREADYQKAVDYYSKARAIGPKLPPVLYGLFGLYQAHGNVAGMKDVGGTILTYWPDDARVSDVLKVLPK